MKQLREIKRYILFKKMDGISHSLSAFCWECLTPRSDSHVHVTSSYNTHKLSCKQVMRMLKFIRQKLLIPKSNTNFSWVIYEEVCRSKKGELTIRSLEIKGLLQFLIIDYSSWKDIQTTKLHLNTCYRNNYKNKFLKVSNQLLTKLTLSKAFPTTRVLPNVCKWDVMTLPKQNTQVQLKKDSQL